MSNNFEDKLRECERAAADSRRTVNRFLAERDSTYRARYREREQEIKNDILVNEMDISFLERRLVEKMTRKSNLGKILDRLHEAERNWEPLPLEERI